MTDLDEALRAMLRERATDITVVPADLVDLSGLEMLGNDVNPGRGRGHHGRRWTLAAAAVAAALVGGVALGVHGLSHKRPANPAPTPPPAPATTCTTPLPSAWRTR